MAKQFKELSSKENLLCFDTLNLAFRYKNKGEVSFADDLVNTVHSIASSYKAKKVIVLGDGGSTYRYNIYPNYKESRKKLRENQSKEEADYFKEFLAETDKAIDLLSNSYLVLKYRGLEADDLAAYIVKHYSRLFPHTWLISSDKDWDLLVSDTVSRWSYRTRKETTINNWNEHYPYDPEQHIDIKVIMGDKGDDVPGVEGIGEKRAYALLREYGTAFDVYDAIPIDSKLKYIQNLNNFKEQLLLNMQLMDLLTYCEEALLDNIEEIDSKITEYLK